jgi:predicted metal-binding protein
VRAAMNFSKNDAHGVVDYIPSNRPWSRCLAICEKCATKAGVMDADKSKLRVELKQLIADRQIKDQIRAVDVSCLDICPEGLIAVALFTENQIRTFNVSPKITGVEVLRKIEPLKG